MSKADDEVFIEALMLESHELRVAYVQSACSNDIEQADRVLQLLAAYDQMNEGTSGKRSSLFDRSGAIISAVLAESSCEMPVELKAGDRVGPYTIEKKLGMGGVGIVYLASQSSPIRRHVALKALKPGMDSIRILARFKVERYVLAQLEHPGITRILDAGMQENGQPYYTMELVRQPTSITDYCTAHGLSLPKRVELMMAVCEVFQYAHQKGIIHRDIKPSNLLMDNQSGSQPVLKVIDFGIAKIIDASEAGFESFTTVGERFGTPAYMSPEQSENCFDVDTRSDVYSLGVVFFEMLTGENPFSVQRSHGEKDSTSGGNSGLVPKPSEWLRNRAVDCPERSRYEWHQLRGDLDSIVMKAIAKDRNCRYQSVQELNRDLASYLAGKPVEAVRPTQLYHLRKYVERHRLASIVALLFLFIIVGSSIVSTTFAIQARRSEQRYKQQLQQSLVLQRQVEQERDMAEVARKRAVAIMRFNRFSNALDEASIDWTKLVVEGQKVPDLSGLKYFYEPHQRLIVKGDWSWAKPDNIQEFITLACDMTSDDIAAVLREEPHRMQTDIYDSSFAQSAGDYNEILLHKLAKLVPANDPLIAEVLDNLALYEQDAGKLKEAELHFEAATDLWKQFPTHQIRLIQSQLFLAATLIQEDKISQASQILAQVGQVLSETPLADPMFVEIQQMHNKLATASAQ